MGRRAHSRDWLYQLVSDHTGSSFAVEPLVIPSTGAEVVWEDVTSLAWMAGQSAGGGLTPGFGGPWTIDWEEAV